MTICYVDDCSMEPKTAGLCSKHYTRRRRTGTFDLVNTIGPGAFGSKHRMWTGDDVTYRAVHKRLDRTRGKARDHSCVDCGAPAFQWSYDNTDPDPKWSISAARTMPYSADLDRYVPRCLSCHKSFDNSENIASAALRPLGMFWTTSQACAEIPTLNTPLINSWRKRGRITPRGRLGQEMLWDPDELWPLAEATDRLRAKRDGRCRRGVS